MAAAFYEEMRDEVADKLLLEFGKTLTLRVEDDAAVFDGATGFVTDAGTSVDHSVTGVVLNIKRKEEAGTNIKKEMKKVILSGVSPTTSAPLTIVPDTSMLLVDGSTIYEITKVDPLSPDGTDVIYTLRVAV